MNYSSSSRRSASRNGWSSPQATYVPAYGNSPSTPVSLPRIPASSSQTSKKNLSPDWEQAALRYLSPDDTGSSGVYPGTLDYTHHSTVAPERDYLRPSYNGIPMSPETSSTASSSSPSSPANQTVTFSECPKCKTVEHHFISASRTCGRCGHKRYFVSAPFPPVRIRIPLMPSLRSPKELLPSQCLAQLPILRVPTGVLLASLASSTRMFVRGLRTSTTPSTKSSPSGPPTSATTSYVPSHTTQRFLHTDCFTLDSSRSRPTPLKSPGTTPCNAASLRCPAPPPC